MKRIYLTLVSAALLFVGCTNDLDEGLLKPSTEDSIAVELLGSINQVTTTRVNDEGFCDGDGVGIYVVNYNGESAGEMLNKGNQADNVRYVFNETEYKWTPDYPIYYYDKVTPVDIIGYYPYVSNIDKVNDYSFEVQKDQSTDAANGLMGGYEASDFLWGKAEKITPTSSRVNITFNHKMAGVQVELVEGTGFGENEWSGLEKQVLVTNTIRKASIDLATGEVTPIGEVPTTGTVPAVNDDGWRAVVVPQSVGASVALFNITVDGTSYIFRKSEAFEYISGKLHKFTIEVSKKSASGLEFKLIGEAITAWESETITHDGTAREYVVINVPAASIEKNESALKLMMEASGKDCSKIRNLKVTGEINACDFFFMRDEMTTLKCLNIEEVKIKGTICDTSYAWEVEFEDDEIPNDALNDKKYLERIMFPDDIKRIGDQALYQTNIVNVYIPDSVEYIGHAAFGFCDNLMSINIPNSVVEIGNNAFAHQYYHKLSFSPLQLPNSLRKIGDSAFSGTKIEGKLSLPNNLEEIGSYAFADCGFSGDLIIPPKIKEIPYRCFYNNYIEQLTLPNGLEKIGKESLCGTGELILPNSLIEIEAYAFNGSPYDYGKGDYVSKFSGRLVIPESVIYVGAGAFTHHNFSGTFEVPASMSIVPYGLVSNNKISTVIIHSDVEEIEESAFGMITVRRVVCLAKTPPRLHANNFGHYWDSSFQPSMSVEVPEASLQKYQQADVWGDFMPSVYRDFKIDNEYISALNATFCKKTIVKAPSEMSWSVIHKPDWVTVTPSEGAGKVEVTITFDELAHGGGNRVDSLVFKPTDYDYHKVIKLNQYDYEYGDGDVITTQTATVGNGVNVVFMGDCFDAKDIAEGYYKEIMDEAIEHFFAVEPYTTYRDYFNVYTIVGHSPDSGIPTTYSVNQESKFGSQYAGDSTGFEFKYDDAKCFEYACKAPAVTKDNLNQTLVVLIENSNVYGGVTRIWYDNSAIAVCSIMRGSYPFDFRGIIQHEAGGHGFGKLADEYIYHASFIDMCNCSDGCGHTQEFLRGQNNGWYQNLSLNSNIYEVPWSHMIFDPQFQTYVDMYEGGYFHQRGVFRSEHNSCMNNNVPYFSAISREQIVKRIMEYAGEEYSFEKFKAKDNSAMGPIPDVTSSVSRVNAIHNCIVTEDATHNTLEIMGEKPMLNF